MITLGELSPPVAHALERALEGRALSVEECEPLCRTTGRELFALGFVADELRRRQAGELVTYVVNRNINFTNVCVKSCHFCAFSRDHRSEEGYFLSVEQVVERALEARALGATELCLQAGIAPGLGGDYYVDLCRALKRAAPELHLHAFSPEEVKYGARLAGRSFRDYLTELRDAGLGSLPGTSAEILDDAVRERLAPGRISTAEWLEVIRTAHGLGIPTTSTMMFGHLETDLERLRHLALLREVQEETGGFTEFVPLAFVHTEAPLYAKRLAPGVRPGPTGNEVLRLFAISRLMLGASIPNLQVSWVKEGLREAAWLLSCGANDLGGTLMNESISTAAGAGHGQFVTPRELRRTIRDAGRIPAERSTRYGILRRFDEPSEDGDDALDRVDDADARFGSYAALTRSSEDRFVLVREVGKKARAARR
ncbi:MAG: 5-amino-6-(D-ribitylamino)uracil--L-tyrosine 4-hydroxyphenyl transferase CofH [Sorangiineae bacterium]|nr:5-amino-6-(D-ribitylamino)uracil--L-tyrosine 4-hydroxyphenyl transferase CofH [Polyangiaceae bacterium]MEB2324394.1 5-amino-6-(D-ribitylamino)uracil--L-tyrosine 4-hydroxyphenyl transferase CofH [Sorangiineae bacterium]